MRSISPNVGLFSGKGAELVGCFVQAQLSDIEALVERVREARLRDIVKQGIGYLHEGMHPGDQDIIHTLFQSGAIQVCPLLPCLRFALHTAGLTSDYTPFAFCATMSAVSWLAASFPC